MTSEFRPRASLIAATQHRWLCDRLALQWGVTPLLLPRAPKTAEAVIDTIADAALSAGLLHPGQDVVIAAGSRLNGPSDLIKLHQVPAR
jgi:pyruvate kinase